MLAGPSEDPSSVPSTHIRQSQSSEDQLRCPCKQIFHVCINDVHSLGFLWGQIVMSLPGRTMEAQKGQQKGQRQSQEIRISSEDTSFL